MAVCIPEPSPGRVLTGNQVGLSPNPNFYYEDVVSRQAWGLNSLLVCCLHSMTRSLLLGRGKAVPGWWQGRGRRVLYLEALDSQGILVFSAAPMPPFSAGRGAPTLRLFRSLQGGLHFFSVVPRV